MSIDLHNALTFAVRIAKEAGYILKGGFQSSFSIHTKNSPHDLVTEYDLLAEQFLTSKIQDHYPDHAIIAEESGISGSPENTYCWIIDPLDGTMNFSKGIPFFSISIALAYHHEVLLGVVYHVMQEEMFTALKDQGAHSNGKALRASQNQVLSRSLIATGFPYNLIENPNHCIEHFSKLLKTGVPIRRMGSAAIDLCYIAAGRFDGFWEIALKPWDFTAGWLIVQEAGGLACQMDGMPLNPYRTSSVLASNGKIQEALMRQLVL
jgi:myo-inositol-1(or 4)-monophosphatase